MKESVSSLFFLLILFLLSSPPFIIIHPLHPHAPPPPLSSTPLHVILSPLQKMVRLLQFVENSPPVTTIRRFNAIVSQLKMHYFSGGAFESLIASQLLKKEKYI